MKRRFLCVAVALLVMAGTVVHGEEIKAGGGGTPIDGYLRPVKEHFEKSSGVALSLNFSSASLAFKQLMAGELDVSTAGLSYDDFLNALKRDNIAVADPSAYVATTIGASKIYTVIHKENPVSKLSREELQGIFTGRIANWKDVGGKDAPILVVLSKINPATNAAFRKLAMADAPFATDVLDAGRFEDVREKVSANPEAIAFGPVTMLDATIKTVQTPDFSRPVVLITKGQPSAKVQKLIAYLKGEGRSYIKE